DIFLRSLAHRLVAETAKRDALVAVQLVGVDDRAGKHVPADFIPQVDAADVGNNPRQHVAALFEHSENDRHVVLAATATAVGLAAQIRLVDFHRHVRAADRFVTVQIGHVFADLIAHAPSRLVSHAKLALDALRGNAVPSRREQEHHVEPIAQRRTRAIKGSAGSRVKLVRAPVALIGAATANAAVFRRTPALGAVELVAVAHLKQVIEAAILSRELVLKLAKRGSSVFHSPYIANPLTCFKGIYALARDDGRSGFAFH